VKTYLQYFNCEKMGRFPNGAEALRTHRMGVFSKLPSVKDSTGGSVFVIAGLGKPKRYYLWETFTIDDVRSDGTQYTLSGPGWVLLPPQPLAGKDFDKFKAACANLVSFRAIDDQPYRDTLRKLAEKYRGDDVNAGCEDFCTELIELLPDNGDAYYYRGTVRQGLGKAAAAKEDFTRALALGTNFPQEAQAGVENPAPAAAAGKKPAKEPAGRDRLAEQIVSKGLFAAGGVKKPAGVSDAVWRGVLQRRGPEDLRQKLLAAYGGRCAITGTEGEPALEAALLVGDAATGPHELSNAVLLRGDVRTLFDLNLIRIHPRTRKVYVAEPLKKGSYARLSARQLRLPERVEDRPSVQALRQRWEEAGGMKS
jgi:hypothetical protein